PGVIAAVACQRARDRCGSARGVGAAVGTGGQQQDGSAAKTDEGAVHADALTKNVGTISVKRVQGRCVDRPDAQTRRIRLSCATLATSRPSRSNTMPRE